MLLDLRVVHLGGVAVIGGQVVGVEVLGLVAVVEDSVVEEDHSVVEEVVVNGRKM
jgi:hypothetical protein